MGFYYDWLNMKWVEKPAVQSKPPFRIIPRQTLIEALIEEIEKGDSETKLFAGLLARKLIVGNPFLMKEFGKQVADISGKERLRRTG